MRIRVFIFITILLAGMTAPAQTKEQMGSYQAELQQLFEEVYNAPTDNQRYHANEAAVQLMAEALAQPNSMRWSWDFGSRVSVITAPDKKFRIFTWPVVSDAGEYECFGFLQVLNDKTDEYDVYTLNDMSQDIINRQETTLTPDNWFGAVYQELVTTRHDGKTYYTLLGWTGVDALTQRKVIEPIYFKGSGAQPQFGQNLFKKERNLRRIVLEYTTNAMVNLRYEEQYIRTVERIRAKRSSRGGGKARRGSKAKRTAGAVNEKVRSAPKEKITDSKATMILFDEVTPQVEGMEGLYQYYIPSGAEMAYVWADGKWELRQGAQGRVTDKRLNQDFDKPMQKKAPAYKVN